MGLLPWLCGATLRLIKKLRPSAREHLLNSTCATAASPGRWLQYGRTILKNVEFRQWQISLSSMPCFIIADLKISVSFYVELLRESAVHVGREFFCNFQNRN
jgi:hypothetical protein